MSKKKYFKYLIFFSNAIEETDCSDVFNEDSIIPHGFIHALTCCLHYFRFFSTKFTILSNQCTCMHRWTHWLSAFVWRLMILLTTKSIQTVEQCTDDDWTAVEICWFADTVIPMKLQNCKKKIVYVHLDKTEFYINFGN